MQNLGQYLDELTDPVALVRKYAVRNLAAHGAAEEVAPYVAEMLKDPEDVVRIEAVWALQKLDGPVAQTVLPRALQDPSKDIRDAARKALGMPAETEEPQQQAGKTVVFQAPGAEEEEETGPTPPPLPTEQASPAEPAGGARRKTVALDTSGLQAEEDEEEPVEAAPTAASFVEEAESESEPSGRPKTMILDVSELGGRLEQTAPAEPVDPDSVRLEEHPNLAELPEDPEDLRRALLLAEALANMDVMIEAVEGEFEVEVYLGTRTQRVFITYEELQGEIVMSIYTICGPASPDSYRWALELNSRLAFATMAIQPAEGGGEEFIMVNSLIERTADIPEIRKAILTVAEKGDWVEERITGDDMN